MHSYGKVEDILMQISQAVWMAKRASHQVNHRMMTAQL